MQTEAPDLIFKFDAGNPVHEYGLAMSPDGHYLLTGGTPDTPHRDAVTVSVWPSNGGAPVARFDGDGIFTACAWSPDNRTIVVVRLVKGGSGPRQLSARPVITYSTEVRLIDAASIRVRAILNPPDLLVRCAQFDPHGKLLALGGQRSSAGQTGDAKGRAVIFQAADGKVVQEMAHGDDVDAAVFVPNSNLIATDSGSPVGDDWGNTTVRLWDVRTGRLVNELARPHGDAPNRIAASPDGTLLASGDGPEGNVLLWDVRTGKTVATLSSDSNTIYTTAFSPDGALLATGSRDGKVRLWSVGARKLLRTVVGHAAPVHALVFAPDGKRLFSGETKTYAGMVCAWNVVPPRS